MFHVGFSFHSRIVAEAQSHGQSLLRTPHSMFRETSKPLWTSKKCQGAVHLITSQLSKPSYFPSQHKPFCSPVGLQFNQSFAHQETVSSKQSRTMRKRWRVKEGRQEAVHSDRLAGLLPFSEVRLCWLSGWQLNPRRPSQEAAHWARHRRCGGPRRAGAGLLVQEVQAGAELPMSGACADSVLPGCEPLATEPLPCTHAAPGFGGPPRRAHVYQFWAERQWWPPEGET